MSEPTGPHGSLLVATTVSNKPVLKSAEVLTIANLDFHSGVPLCNVLHTSHNLRHGGDGKTRSKEGLSGASVEEYEAT